ncbi:hypothetical protein M9H77_17649 [Catharanthus roseus]|uniref:Uncharacterized protein n=1 Tax=Catharanthus roseus TaxID=4058 RepID=A0ACC0B581_CATRO|nr:hypothetical protein M9H77_17649 [Catharanthus roseus]
MCLRRCVQVVEEAKIKSGLVATQSVFLLRAVNRAGLTYTCAGLYPFLAGKKIEKYHMGTGIPRPYPGPWRVGSESRILYPGGYGSGFGSKFNYKGTSLGLGVP